MINLSGLTIKSAKNPKGDIEIIYVGLRPGEKLYEELLVEQNAEKTSHHLIFKAEENYSASKDFLSKLNLLEKLVKEQDETNALLLLKEIVPEYKSNNSEFAKLD